MEENHKETSFLSRLSFDVSLEKTPIARYFTSIRAILLIILTITGAGLATFLSLPRELNPNIQIPIVFVSTAFPGAGPEDIESLVTIPLEDATSGLSGVQTVTSTSQDNVSTISIEFTSRTDPQKAKNDVQSAIDTVTTLPDDAKKPEVRVLDFQQQPVLQFLIATSADAGSLVSFANTLEDRLKDVSGVESVSVNYRKDSEVTIALKPENLREKHLSLQAVTQSISAAINNFPAGSVQTDRTTFALSQDTAAQSVAELRNLPLNVDGQILPLGEIASVQEQPAVNKPEAFFADTRTSGTRAITFSVFKTDTADTAETVAAVNTVVNQLRAPYGDQFIFQTYFDGAQEINKSFTQLFHDFSLTILFVGSVLFTFFGLRQSIIAALAIPLTFLGTFLVMGSVGISINFIALFSLLLSLGILVDNAIVIISAIAAYDRTKKFTPQQVALLVWRDFRTVIFTTTITTVWAFLPLLLASGIIGEFIKPIPIVVSSALAISACIALFIVIPMMAAFLTGRFPRRALISAIIATLLTLIVLLFLVIPAGPYRYPLFCTALIAACLLVPSFRSLCRIVSTYEASHFTRFFQKVHGLSQHGLLDFDPLAHRYERFIRSILVSRSARRKTLAALIIFSIFSYALVPLGYVVNEFFPQSDEDTAYVSVRLPKGTSLTESKTSLLPLLDRLRTSPDVRSVLAEIGALPPTGAGAPGAVEFSNLLFTLTLTPAKERSQTSGEIVAALNQDFKNYSQGILSASQLSGGPPAGSDLQLKLLGSDLETLQRYAHQVSDYLATQPGITTIATSVENGSSKIVFVPDQNALAQENLNADQTAFLLRTLGSGFIIKNDQRFSADADNRKHDVILRLDETTLLGQATETSILSIPTSKGDLPLLALGDFRLQPNPTLITREDGKRTLSITASVANGFSVTTASDGLETFADSLNLPQGYSWKTGGANEENQKSVRSILLAMLLSAALIFATMTIQFNSFRQAIIVLLVIPLAVSGVFILFALTGTPLSFPSLIGILALFGIVVNNSIIMVDKINRNMSAGLPLVQAISEGAASRLEPILLTALTTIVGLIPISLSDPIWRGLGGAIIAGLTFSGIAKLFFIPVIYRIWFGGQATTDKEQNPSQSAVHIASRP